MIENSVILLFGKMVEQTNGQPGTLDVAPFGNGPVDSWFNVFFNLDVNGTLLQNQTALGLHAVIHEKPPFRRYIHLVPPDEEKIADSEAEFSGMQG